MKLIDHSRNQRWIAALIIVLFFAIGAVTAQGENQVGLIVVHENGNTLQQCISFEQEEITGVDLLQRANEATGLDYLPDSSGGNDTIICRIDNQGCNFPAEPCFCQCGAEGPCRVWSYWYFDEGAGGGGTNWVYSQLGAGYPTVRHGDVKAWVWIERASPNSEDGGSMPPDLTFEDICAPPTETPTETPTTEVQPSETLTPTGTPVPDNTATPTETSTRTPTSEASPTATETPTFTPTTRPRPTIVRFGADRSQIDSGETVMLSWDVANSDSTVLHIDGQQEIVANQGSRAVSPRRTTTYVLTARNTGGETAVETTVAINLTLTTPTPAGLEPPTEMPTPIPTDTPLSTETPVPTETPLPPPTPMPTEMPTETPVATNTWTVTPLPIETPTALAIALADDGQGDARARVVLPVLPSEDGALDGSDPLRRLMAVGGIVFVLGIPLLFAGIWLIVYSLWKQK